MEELTIDHLLNRSSDDFNNWISSTVPYSYSYSNNNDNNSNDFFNVTMCPPNNMPISSMAVMVMYAVVCIIGVMGNTLVIYVVLRFSNMQTVTNMYILNLAIADECFLIGIPFLITTMHFSHWPFGSFMCKAYMVSTSITQFTSSIFLFIMSADRYIAICHHISSLKYRTPLVSRIVVAIAWLVSAITMLPIIIFSNTITSGERTSCRIIWPDSHEPMASIYFTLYSFFLGFAVPLCFIMTFYCLVIRKLRSVSKKTQKSRNKKRSHRKVTKLVLTVITVYILCWLPYWVSQVALISSEPKFCNTRLEITLFLLVGCLGYVNSAINPILYAYLSDNFKKSFMKACTCTATKEVNAQLKLENSVMPRKSRHRANSETPMTITTTTTVSSSKFNNNRLLNCNDTLTNFNTTTTTTHLSNASSRNPSPVVPHKSNNNHHHHVVFNGANNNDEHGKDELLTNDAAY